MPRFFVLLLSILAVTAWAGDITPSSPAPRREFRQRKTYPYIFEPVSYLGSGVLQPVHLDGPAEECTHHAPPTLPKPTPTPTPTPTPAPSQSPASTPSKPDSAPTPAPKADAAKPQATPEPSPDMPSQGQDPAYPAPDNAQPVPQRDALDMTKYPAEVVDIFKNPYNIPKSRKQFFDPVFEPAQPPPQPPASKATYRQE